MSCAQVSIRSHARSRILKSKRNTCRPDADLNAGLIWNAGDWDARRSIPFEIIRGLGSIKGVRWHVLQRGSAAHLWNKSFGLDSRRDDLLELAQLVAGLDLLISVDTMPAHLGGALAVPTWVLLHSECDVALDDRSLGFAVVSNDAIVSTTPLG